jgi:hypothetical protein
VPLQWSESLKSEAKVWADTLLDSCGDGMYHDPQMDWGENAAANIGAGSWGTKRAPEKIVARFIDREVDDPWPINGHLTQAVSVLKIAVLSMFVLSFSSVFLPSHSSLM